MFTSRRHSSHVATQRSTRAEKKAATRERLLEAAGRIATREGFARISLDRTRMQIDDRMVDLSPGMAVTVEIKTGERRIIEFLLSPLLRYKQESLRER